MATVEGKREKEKQVVEEMIGLYCRAHHGTTRATGLCPECAELRDYAQSRRDRCPFMETKTFCSNCRVHCYKPAMREKIRTVMGWSGPRMIFHHPFMAVHHVISVKQEARRLKKEEENR